jgi:hypothetical protein
MNVRLIKPITQIVILILSPEPIGKVNTNKLTKLTRSIGSTSVIHRNRGFLLIYTSKCTISS